MQGQSVAWVPEKSALYLKSICDVGEKHDHMRFHFSCWKICADVVFFSNIK
jgi:hypothetical protein